MKHYIDKDKVVEELEKLYNLEYDNTSNLSCGKKIILRNILLFLDTLEVKEIDLIIHTIIAECCDWLAINTSLSHDKIEGCRNLMLTVKEEQFKTQKEE